MNKSTVYWSSNSIIQTLLEKRAELLKIFNLLSWNRKFHYRFHNNPQLVSVLNLFILLHITHTQILQKPFWYHSLTCSLVSLMVSYRMFCTKIWYALLLLHASLMFHPSHPPWLYHHNNILLRLYIMNLVIMQFSSAPCSLTHCCNSTLLLNNLKTVLTLSLHEMCCLV